MLATPLLTADDLRHWRACERRYWLRRQRALGEAGAPPSAAEADVGAEPAVVFGPSPGDALRATFPGAIAIPAPRTPADWAEAVRLTAACLDHPRLHAEGGAVFGACLVSDDGAQACIDVVAGGERGLRLFKLRHATVGDEADVDDMALWAHVAARCGLRVQSVGLLLVDIDFIYPGHGCYAGLFREVDLGPVLGSRPAASWLVAMRACERGAEPPAQPSAACTQHGTCEFASHCGVSAAAVAAVPDNARLEIVGRDLAASLRDEGHTSLLSVPVQRLADPRHRRALRAIQRHAPEHDDALAPLIQALPWPRHLLRIDTIGFAVPIWPGTRPYQVLPFQWSCAVASAPGQPWQPHGYLADASGDPRRAFAESLLKALGSHGAVIAYNAGFERNRIQELALQFTDLAPALQALLPRVVDLFQIARAHYYHPAMNGSWSFKAMARAVGAPPSETTGEASVQVLFARSLQRGLDDDDVRALRGALRAHGQSQTDALRRMLAVFEAGPAAAPP